MHVYMNIFGLKIPSYGLMIAMGVIVANMVAYLLHKRFKDDINDLLILEAYGFLGGFFGAKLLYLIISFRSIEWNRIMEPQYFNELMLGGFVFYGGLIVGLLFVFLAGKLHKIEVVKYIRNYIFLVPFIHCFGRVGCFLAGCCYGIPYEGPGAVIFPKESFALSGISLFPVQLVEAVGLLVIAIILLLIRKLNCNYSIEIYFILYAILRFVLEKLRYDENRGIYYGLSTSQWISIGMLTIAIILGVLRYRNKKKWRAL